jgi:hypothetical protein
MARRLAPTGDRIDVVLKDALDRFVAVEVEVDCDATNRAYSDRSIRIALADQRDGDDANLWRVGRGCVPSFSGTATNRQLENGVIVRRRNGLIFLSLAGDKASK